MPERTAALAVTQKIVTELMETAIQVSIVLNSLMVIAASIRRPERVLSAKLIGSVVVELDMPKREQRKVSTMKITIHDEYQGEITIEVSQWPHKIYPAACPNAVLLCAKLWDIEGLNVTLQVAIGTDGCLKHAWTFEPKRANGYLHLDPDYEEHNKCIRITDGMMETIEGLFSGRIKIDGLHIPVGASAQLRKLDIEAEQKRSGHPIFLS
jgi:hypothetical protein